MIQNKKIYMHAWLQCHCRTKQTSTDGWYLDFANRLLPLVGSHRAALLLTMYFEDTIANAGGWRRFCDLCHSLYGTYLPFYELTESYIPDEINEADIAFVLWKLHSDADGDTAVVANPFDSERLQLAKEVYRRMDAAFEQAPIAELPSGDWVIPSEQLLVESIPLPAIEPGVTLPQSVKLFLDASGGEQLMYFPLYSQMEDFFVEHLHWNRSDLPGQPEEDNVVLFANPKGILMAPGVAQFFCDDRNRTAYDAAASANEGYRLFTDKGVCPFDLLKYGVQHNLFPDACLPFENGKEILRKNWDFIARYFLGEYYEGR